MTQWVFYFDQKRCLGCATCTAACKEWNEGRRGDAAFNTLTEDSLKRYVTPNGWKAPAKDGAVNRPFLRRFDMKENWRKVTFHEFGTQAPNVDIVPLSLACNHCAKPACAAVCPVKAITKDREFGAVIVDSKKCIGCGACAKACPWDVPQYYEDPSKTAMNDVRHPHMTKCDMCVDRLKAGLKPACVASCPGRALECAPVEEILKRHPDAKHYATGFPLEKARQTMSTTLFTPRAPRVK